MRRLSGLDADLLSAETPAWHLHVAAVIVADARAEHGGRLGYDDWRRLMGHLAQQAPVFRERLIEVPGGLDKPLAIDDPHFCLDDHLHRADVPAAGGRAELAGVVGAIAGHKLDRSRPLWDAWYLEGLAGGRVATYVRLHHALADGVGGALALRHLFAPEPAPVADLREFPRPSREQIPSGAELVARSLGSLATAPLRAARAVPHTIRSLRGARHQRGDTQSDAAKAPFRAPRTSFNHAVTPNRAVAFASVPLADVRQVKNAFDATVNDVVLAICAGALRRWLAGRGELPDQPLVAAVPVSTRTLEQLDEPGNRVSGWFVTLATHIEDPVERLRVVRQGAAGAKAVYDSGIEDALIEWSDIPAPLVTTLGIRMLGALHVSERVPPIFNLLVSNVRLTSAPSYQGEAPVEAIFPLGPVLGNVGLNITVLSQHDAVHFGLLSCPELVPDLQALAASVQDALGELVAAAERTPDRRR